MKKVRRFDRGANFQRLEPALCPPKETKKRDVPPFVTPHHNPNYSSAGSPPSSSPHLSEPLTKLMDRPYFRWGYLLMRLDAMKRDADREKKTRFSRLEIISSHRWRKKRGFPKRKSKSMEIKRRFTKQKGKEMREKKMKEMKKARPKVKVSEDRFDSFIYNTTRFLRPAIADCQSAELNGSVPNLFTHLWTLTSTALLLLLFPFEDSRRDLSFLTSSCLRHPGHPSSLTFHLSHPLSYHTLFPIAIETLQNFAKYYIIYIINSQNHHLRNTIDKIFSLATFWKSCLSDETNSGKIIAKEKETQTIICSLSR